MGSPSISPAADVLAALATGPAAAPTLAQVVAELGHPGGEESARRLGRRRAPRGQPWPAKLDPRQPRLLPR